MAEAELAYIERSLNLKIAEQFRDKDFVRLKELLRKTYKVLMSVEAFYSNYNWFHYCLLR